MGGYGVVAAMHECYERFILPDHFSDLSTDASGGIEARTRVSDRDQLERLAFLRGRSKAVFPPHFLIRLDREMVDGARFKVFEFSVVVEIIQSRCFGRLGV